MLCCNSLYLLSTSKYRDRRRTVFSFQGEFDLMPGARRIPLRRCCPWRYGGLTTVEYLRSGYAVGALICRMCRAPSMCFGVTLPILTLSHISHISHISHSLLLSLSRLQAVESHPGTNSCHLVRYQALFRKVPCMIFIFVCSGLGDVRRR